MILHDIAFHYSDLLSNFDNRVVLLELQSSRDMNRNLAIQ